MVLRLLFPMVVYLRDKILALMKDGKIRSINMMIEELPGYHKSNFQSYIKEMVRAGIVELHHSETSLKGGKKHFYVIASEVLS